jgi:hypothetical protein
MGPSTQQFFSSSDVIATTCFDHTIIIRRQTAVYCRKLYPANSYSKPFATVHHCLPPDDDRMIETCCGITIGRGEEELLR